MSDAILALDTSSGSHVSLVSGSRVLATRTQPDARAHAEHLTPLVEQVLAEAGLAVGDLTAIAVGTGPAPFTGLRVGLVTAQMLSLGTGLPVWGVPSLDAWAAAALHEDALLAHVLVATDARRKEVYTASYARDVAAPGGLRREGDFAVHRPPAVDGPVPAAGTASALYPDAYRTLGDVPPVLAAHHLALLGAARAAAGEPQPTTPLYLRRPDVHGVPGSLETDPAVVAGATAAGALPTTPRTR